MEEKVSNAEEQIKIKEQIIKKIMEIVKKELYDIINFDDELSLDTHIIKILNIIFGGLMDRIVIYLINKDYQDIYEITRTDIEYGSLDEKIKQIQLQHDLKKYKFEILSSTAFFPDIYNNFHLFLNLYFISPFWAGIIFIPLKRIVHPQEGELYAIDENSLNQIKVIKVKNDKLNIGPLKFIEPKILLTA